MSFEQAVGSYERGDLRAAWDACERAFDESEPDHRLLHLMGLIAFQLNRPGEAHSYLERAAEHAPEEARYLCDLALPCFARGDLQAGIARIDQALALQPDYLPALERKSAALMQLNRSSEALPLFETLAERDRHPQRVMSLALCLRSLGKLDEARSHLEEMLARHASCGQGWWLLAGLRRATRETDHLRAMESALESATNVDDKVPLLFALAKEHEDVGDFDHAFERYAEANALRRKGLAYDIEKDAALFARIMARDKAPAPARRAALADEDTPIFVVSMPRTGSTLVERILGAHSKVCAAGELPLVSRLVNGISARKGMPYPQALENISKGDLDAMRHAYLSRSRQWRDGSRYFVDKMPVNFLYLGLLAKIFPAAVFVHVYRNPVDTCLSCYRQLFGDYYQFSYDLGELGNWYGMYRELMAHWRRLLPGRILDVEYEALVSDPDAEARRLLEHCGLDWEPACLEFMEGGRAVRTPSAEQVRRGIYSDSVGRWKHYEGRLEPLLLALGRHIEA
ncbi:MAG: hypothetical protein HKN59_04130 [Gammaproteobacteria bacterium]|nr:hypothetical protein [Gammaproteobacteria bacterium]